ncbi:MAG: DUF1016 N-terminal domain-containing protein [Dissulfurimicrobium sp.]|uniref:DUF1016 N-terminal domain-containing protein n=1 Tax=Dissulfurimicrobium TaxID=1769732 RepID=UPI003C78BFF9
MRNVSTANSAMVLLYWEVGRMILVRQARSGWGAKVIDRLARDLREAFPGMKGLSPRNLKYMRAFAAAWPDQTTVQETLAQISWYHNLTLLEKLDEPNTRLWYARQTIKHGWSRRVLVQHIRSRLKERQVQRLAPDSRLFTRRPAAGWTSGPSDRHPSVCVTTMSVVLV